MADPENLGDGVRIVGQGLTGFDECCPGGGQVIADPDNIILGQRRNGRLGGCNRVILFDMDVSFCDRADWRNWLNAPLKQHKRAAAGCGDDGRDPQPPI
jgi:hypothetical protein